jgi:hypothetical protein
VEAQGLFSPNFADGAFLLQHFAVDGSRIQSDFAAIKNVFDMKYDRLLRRFKELKHGDDFDSVYASLAFTRWCGQFRKLGKKRLFVCVCVLSIAPSGDRAHVFSCRPS